jgi:anionic cell wall polymer biosynthesis LytR-Cps2A-Psr (LCP) family protein
MHIGKNGLKLKAGQRQLDGKKALAFSRTRHSDTDYDRSRRQHQVLTAAAVKVRKRGADQLASLVDVARKKIVTDMPLRAAPALLELAGLANLDKIKSVVLEPGRYARQLPGTYTITPRVLEVQQLFDKLFKPVDAG